MTFEGGCLCGAIRVAIAQKPKRVSHCHCLQCRKATGAAVATLAAFDTKNVTWQGNAISTIRVTDFATRGFCRKCGSALTFRFDERPDEVVIHVGCLDNPTETPAIRHNFLSEKLPWLTIDPHLPGKQSWWNPPKLRV